MRHAVVAALLGVLVAGAATASEGRPDLARSLGRARLVVTGSVAGITAYDSGRLTVARIAVSRILKGKADGSQLQVVERHDLSSNPALLREGDHLIAFLVPARRTSSLVATLPQGDYHEIFNGRSGVIAGTDAAEIREAEALVDRLLSLQRAPDKDAAKRAAKTRALVFDEIAARAPLIVADGSAGLTRIDDLAATLTGDEQLRIERALDRTDLPVWIRVSLVDAVADRGLKTLAPALRSLEHPTPELQRATWKALDRLGVPPSMKDLESALTGSDPAIRSAAVAALDRSDPEVLARLRRLALQDPDGDVRRAAIEELGKTGSGALPTLEKAFARGDWAQRQAVGRAITAVGGRAAAESFARLAFEAPKDAQKYAVTLLMLTGIDRNDPLVQRIEQKHPDEDVRHVIESGLELHDH